MKWFSAQLSIAITFLVIAAAGAWYEGSAIRDHTFEWAYSTPISRMIHGEILNANQISQLDHFVYAAKFQPALPLIVVVSALYIMLLVMYRILHHDLKKWMVSLGLLTVVLLITGSLVANSSTAGGHLFFYFFTGSGLLSMAGVIVCYGFMNKQYTKGITS